MAKGSRRTSHAFSKLSLKQRRLAALRTWRAGGQPHDLLFSSAPHADRAEFTATGRIFVGVQSFSLTHVAEVGANLGRLEALVGQYELARYASDALGMAGLYVYLGTREPMPQAEYCERENNIRADVVPVSELAELFVEREPRSPAESPDDVCASNRERLTQLVADGTLVGWEEDGELVITRGSFDDWMGQSTVVMSSLGEECEPWPDDDERGDATRMASLRREVLELTMPELQRGRRRSPGVSLAQVASRLLPHCEQEVVELWQYCRGVDYALEVLTARYLESERPAFQALQEPLDDLKTRLRELVARLKHHKPNMKLSEPSRAYVVQILRLIASHGRLRPKGRPWEPDDQTLALLTTAMLTRDSTGFVYGEMREDGAIRLRPPTE